MSFNPPNSLCLFQKATAISLTGTTSITTLDSYTLKGGMMGLSDWLMIDLLWSNNNSGNSKTLTVSAGGSNLNAVAQTTNLSTGKRCFWVNQNSLSSQKLFLSTNAIGLSTSTNAPTTAIDTSQDVSILFRGTLANAGDTIALEAYSVYIAKGGMV